jgi:cytochrome c oxidase cbb3-type subunit III
MNRKPLLFLFLLPVLLVTGCRKKIGPPDDSQELLRPEQVVSFDGIYMQNCSACHGEHGGNGPALDLSNPEYQALVDDRSLRSSITNGMPGTEMPAFGESAGGFLTDVQIDVLVKGMRTRWAKSGYSRAASMPPYLATLTADKTRGAGVYQTSCASCHQGLKQPTDATYLALMSDQALRTIVIAGRPDLGHPGWTTANDGHPLSDQEITDIVGYLGSFRSATPGQPYPEQLKSER